MMTNNYKPFVAGVPISVERLSEGLRAMGHEVTVFAPTYDEQEEEKDVFRYRTLLKGVAGGIVIPSPIDLRIEKEFKKNHYDIIHVHHPMLIGKTAAYLSEKYHIPLAFTYHTRYEQYLHYIIPKQILKNRRIAALTDRIVAAYLHSFFNRCSHIFVPTQCLKNYLTQECRYGSDQISVLPTGLKAESYHASEECTKAVREQYHAENIPLFCTVSRMAHEKNVPFLLSAIQRFKEKYKKPFKVLMIGEGPNRAEYETLVSESGLQDEVCFTGAIPNKELNAYYKASDAFIFASKTETQGIVLLEAFAAGIPVIAVDATGVCDLVQDGINGFVTEENIDIFADKMMIPITDIISAGMLKSGALTTAYEYLESEVALKASAQYNKAIMQYSARHSAQEAGKWKISTVS